MTPALRYALVAIAFGAAAAAAGAAPPAPTEPAKPGPALDSLRHHRGPTLTGAALRRCVALDAEWRALHNTLYQENQNLDVEERAFKRLDEELDHELPTLDHTDAAAVDAYNQRVNRHQALVAAYNARLPAHTAVVEKHNALVDRFNAACTGRAYLTREWLEAAADLP